MGSRPAPTTTSSSLGDRHDRGFGIGLDAADRERVFERLYRGARARAMRPSGTGLGLAIARWIVESHAGTIVLANREGGGTVAEIALPLRQP